MKSQPNASHGNSFASMSAAATPDMANAPKGTLPLRTMASRTGGYNPETERGSPGFGYQPHGEDFLYNNTLRHYVPGKHRSIVQAYYAPQNRRLILEAVVKLLREQSGGTDASLASADNIPVHIVDQAMQEAYEIAGETPDNSPHATVGPNEDLAYLAPASKYGDLAMNVGQCRDESLARMNQLAATLLRDSIVGERALLSRYHKELSGAIHVLEHPSRPGPELRRGHQLNFSYFDDISSAANSGISGNRLSTGTQQSNQAQSVRPGPSVPQFKRLL